MSPNEKHYLVSELASSWKFSKEKIRQLFEAEAGVLRVGSAENVRKGKRRYFSLRIPESVASRVYARLTRQGVR